MAKFWPYHHSQCMGENMEKYTEHHPAYLVGDGVCRHDIFNKSSWRCELSYEILPITLCAL